MPIVHSPFPLLGSVVTEWALMIERIVRRHLPHSDPAPHACDTSREVVAPAATASETVSIVTP
ncbi:hypothetical protein A5662_26870 [Mycobacteriaceae bacterium 1482268.1]|nr:hypothetical protein A5662_26870 [Mycobacteriaceae bacterium 1482268.1]